MGLNQYVLGGCVNSGVFWIRNNDKVRAMMNDLLLQLKSNHHYHGQVYFSEILCGKKNEANFRSQKSDECHNSNYDIRTFLVSRYQLVHGEVWQRFRNFAFLPSIQKNPVKINQSLTPALIHVNYAVGVQHEKQLLQTTGRWLLP